MSMLLLLLKEIYYAPREVGSFGVLTEQPQRQPGKHTDKGYLLNQKTSLVGSNWQDKETLPGAGQRNPGYIKIKMPNH